MRSFQSFWGAVDVWNVSHSISNIEDRLWLKPSTVEQKRISVFFAASDAGSWDETPHGKKTEIVFCLSDLARPAVEHDGAQA